MSRGPPMVREQLWRAIEEPYMRGNLLEAVSKVVELRENEARALIGDTTVTAYRRVHEVIASALDRIVSLTVQYAMQRAPAHVAGIPMAELSLELSRALIMLEYQEARGQVSRELANLLRNVLSPVIDKLKAVGAGEGRPSEQDLRELRKAADRARTLLDAVAVLVYREQRRRR